MVHVSPLGTMPQDVAHLLHLNLQEDIGTWALR